MTIPAFYKLKDQAATVLTAPMTATDTTASVASGEILGDAPFRVVIEEEVVAVGVRVGNALSSILRGQCGTTAAIHAIGVAVEIQVIAADITDIQAAIEEIIAGRGIPTYIHDQSVPSASWTITHNLGRYPAVFIVDSAGTVVVGDIVYLTDDSLRVDFASSFGGKAYLS